MASQLFFSFHLRSFEYHSDYRQHIMIQRALLRQSRSLASSLRTSSNTTLFRSQFRPQTLRLAPSASPLASARWYATEPESKDEEKVEGTGAAADQSKQEGASEAENPLAKELESKNKEILDMKVCLLLTTEAQRMTDKRTGQISPGRR